MLGLAVPRSRLRSHLVETLLTILDEKPASPLDAFETVSSCTKVGESVGGSLPVDALTLAKAKEVVELITPPPGELDEEGNPPPEPEKNEPEDLRDLMRDADLLEKAGVGLGKAETYRVVLALKQLADSTDFNLATVRFFGKVFGKKSDYLIAEATPKELKEAVEVSEEDIANGVVPPDAPGVGCNKFSYFVCSAPGTAWTELPDLLPAQLMAARQIKKLMTGDLETPIEGFPVFPGTEKNYLRAQIAQIASETGIAPAGVFAGPWDQEEYDAPEAGSEEAYPDPEFTDLTGDDGDPPYEAPKSLIAQLDPDGWVHESRALLTKQGRCAWFAKPVPEVEEGEPQPVVETPEPSAQGLAPLSTDAEIRAGVPAWSVRRGNAGLDNAEAAAVKSVAWPGAATVCDLNGIKGFYWASVYVGDGARYSGAAFAPPMPPVVVDEAADPVEQFDPTVEEEEAANAPPAEEEEAE